MPRLLRDVHESCTHECVSVDRAIHGSIVNDPQNLAVFTDHTRLMPRTRIAIVIRDPRSASIRVDVPVMDIQN